MQMEVNGLPDMLFQVEIQPNILSDFSYPLPFQSLINLEAVN